MLATSALRTTFVMFAKWHRVRNISEVRDDPSADDSEKLSDARLFGDSSGLLKCSFIFYQRALLIGLKCCEYGITPGLKQLHRIPI